MVAQNFVMGGSLPRVDVDKVKRWAKEAKAAKDPGRLIEKLSAAQTIRWIVQRDGASAGFTNSLAEGLPDRFYLSNAGIGETRICGKHPRSDYHQWLVLWNNSDESLKGKPYCFIAVMLSNDGRPAQEFPEEGIQE